MPPHGMHLQDGPGPTAGPDMDVTAPRGHPQPAFQQLATEDPDDLGAVGTDLRREHHLDGQRVVHHVAQGDGDAVFLPFGGDEPGPGLLSEGHGHGRTPVLVVCSSVRPAGGPGVPRRLRLVG